MLYSRSLELNHFVLLKLDTLNSISYFPSPHPDAHLYPLKSLKINHVWALLPKILIELVWVWSPRWSTAAVANWWSMRKVGDHWSTEYAVSFPWCPHWAHNLCTPPRSLCSSCTAVFLFLENTQSFPTPGPLLLLVPLLDVLSSRVHLVVSYLLKVTLCDDLPCPPSSLPWF